MKLAQLEHDVRKRVVIKPAPCICRPGKRCHCGWLVYFDGHTIGENPEPQGHRNALAEMRRYRKRLVDVLSESSGRDAAGV